MVKFRTMRDAFDEDGKPLPDSERITPFGRTLRSTSLDELPELWNVLKGDMSLVGPRPLLMEYLSLYSSEQARRHAVRPGITGWAQVNGRNAISWPEKFALDVWYVDNHTIWLDLRILLLTVAKVVRREGVTAESSVTAEKFTGNSKMRLAILGAGGQGRVVAESAVAAGLGVDFFDDAQTDPVDGWPV